MRDSESVARELEDEHELVLRRAARRAFRCNPLNLNVPVPWHMAEQECNCPPDAFHAFDCEATPIYTSISGHPDHYWPQLWSGRHQWACYASDTPHVLREINGPRHWCQHTGKVEGNAE